MCRVDGLLMSLAAGVMHTYCHDQAPPAKGVSLQTIVRILHAAGLCSRQHEATFCSNADGSVLCLYLFLAPTFCLSVKKLDTCLGCGYVQPTGGHSRYVWACFIGVFGGCGNKHTLLLHPRTHNNNCVGAQQPLAGGLSSAGLTSLPLGLQLGLGEADAAVSRVQGEMTLEHLYMAELERRRLAGVLPDQADCFIDEGGSGPVFGVSE
jgi:hypothetical protein